MRVHNKMNSRRFPEPRKVVYRFFKVVPPFKNKVGVLVDNDDDVRINGHAVCNRALIVFVNVPDADVFETLVSELHFLVGFVQHFNDLVRRFKDFVSVNVFDTDEVVVLDVFRVGKNKTYFAGLIFEQKCNQNISDKRRFTRAACAADKQVCKVFEVCENVFASVGAPDVKRKGILVFDVGQLQNVVVVGF